MEQVFKTLDENYIKFGSHTISVIIDTHAQLWFNAKETAKSLGYVDARDAIRTKTVPEDKKHLRDIKHETDVTGHPQTLYLNEGGLYNLIFGSRMPKARKFRRWVTHIVLPSIRRYGFYKIRTELESQNDELMERLMKFEKYVKVLEQDLKKEKYPDGALFYVLDYSENGIEAYRIGKTVDMKKRKSAHDTHTLYKRRIVFMVDTMCPTRMETCVRSMLFDYRWKDRKDVFICSLEKVNKSIEMCTNNFECLEKLNQRGGCEKYLHENIIQLREKNGDLLARLREVKRKINKPIIPIYFR